MTDLSKSAKGRTLDHLMEIRAVLPDELALMRHLQTRSFRAAASSILTPHQLEKSSDWLNGQQMFEELLSATRNGHVFGGWLDRTLVTVAGWTRGDGSTAPGRLRWVATDPMFAHQGAGRRVVVHTEFAATAELQTRLAVRALPTFSPFYEKLGYRETGRGSLAIQPAGVPLPVVYLSKPLTHPNVDTAIRH